MPGAASVSGFSAEYVAELRRSPARASLVRLAEPLAEELAAVNQHSPALGVTRAWTCR